MGGLPIILIVEDEGLVRSRIVSEFRRAGWDVLEARTGEGALALLKNSGEIDAVFTDIELGGWVSGWDVADAYRAAYPTISVVYASGHEANASRTVRDSHFFSKPYVCGDVLAACGLMISSESKK